MCILQETMNILSSAGWYSDRKIDTKKIEEYLRCSGYEVIPAVKSFLEEFGMLQLVVENRRSIISGIGSEVIVHHTNPEKAIKDYFTAGSFEQEEIYAGEKLVPVGMICDENLVLFVSETGKIFCQTSKLGDTLWEAFQCIIKQEGFTGW